MADISLDDRLDLALLALARGRLTWTKEQGDRGRLMIRGELPPPDAKLEDTHEGPPAHLRLDVIEKLARAR